MLLALCEVLERRRIDAATFFRAAYQWRFGRDTNVTDDVNAWKSRQIVPDYVSRYVHHLQGEMQ